MDGTGTLFRVEGPGDPLHVDDVFDYIIPPGFRRKISLRVTSLSSNSPFIGVSLRSFKLGVSGVSRSSRSDRDNLGKKELGSGGREGQGGRVLPD